MVSLEKRAWIDTLDPEVRRVKRREYRERWLQKNPDAVERLRQYDRDYQLRRSYGLTRVEYEQMLEQQDGKCAICGAECSTGRRLAVDHDHITGQIRGLLCSNCNLGIGKFHDSVELLKEAIRYLEA